MTHCPVCNSSNLTVLFPEYSGTCITSDMMVLENAVIANRLCKVCGLVFNSRGTRGATKSYYKSAYNLMMQNSGAAIQSFAGPQPVSQAQRSCEILFQVSELPPSGNAIEVGAGKGEFLEHLSNSLQGWNFTALEPSTAFQVLAQRFPNIHTEQCEYTEINATDASFDLVVAMGVLEHVENPLDMLRWASRILKPGGLFFLRVPNFANNPNDLFCVDHLSKLTVSTISSMSQAAGFRVQTVREAGVAVFLLIEKTGGFQTLSNLFEENGEIVVRNIEAARSSINAVVAARRNARAANEAFAVFGLGTSGLFAPLWAKFDPMEITAYVDENKTIWGSTVHGRPVGGLDLIDKLSIKHIALAISPVYFAQVSEKLKPYGVQLYAADS